MKENEINEIFAKGQADGVRLFRVSEIIYKVLVVFNWIFAIAGGILSVVIFGSTSAVGGVVMLLVTITVCAILYAVAVLSTHIAKVLVHILFSNLAIMLKGQA